MTYWANEPEPQWIPENQWFPEGPPGFHHPAAPPPLPGPTAQRPPVSGRRRAVLATLAALGIVVVVLAVGVHSDLVSGSGSALGGGAPAPTASGPAGAPSTESTSAWVTVTYQAGHLRARFPGTPQEQSQSGSISGATFTVNFAVAHDKGLPVEAGCEDVSTPIADTAERLLVMREAISSFGVTSQLTKLTETATTFRSRTGRTATFRSASGHGYSLLTFFAGDTRFYVLFARTGTPFSTLTSSLEILP